MKTYKKTIIQELPQLQIYYVEDAESPRTFQDNLGYFITCERDRHSPDKNLILKNIIEESSEESQNVTEHMALITRRIKNDLKEKVLAIYPVVKYEHSGIVYKIGTKHGFDYSNNGFYIITDKTAKVYGKHAKPIEALIDGELEEYNAWVNGEVYCYKLYDKDGKELDNQGSFYNLEDIKDNLPKTWSDEDLTEYLQG